MTRRESEAQGAAQSVPLLPAGLSGRLVYGAAVLLAQVQPVRQLHGGGVVPVVWESPVPIEAGPAEALAIYITNKAGAYADRTIEKPVQEFTQEDAEDETVIIWWVLVKRDWEDHKIRRKRPQFRVDEKGRRFEVIPLWAPSVMHFGDMAIKRIDRYQRAEYDAAEVAAARAELRELVGFSAYAYFKHELR